MLTGMPTNVSRVPSDAPVLYRYTLILVLFGRTACGRSEKRTTPATVCLSSLISSCFFSHGSGLDVGTTCRINRLAISDLHIFEIGTGTNSFSNDVIPLFLSNRVSLAGLFTGRHCAPLRIYGSPSLALTMPFVFLTVTCKTTPVLFGCRSEERRAPSQPRPA